ncbi:hypothetical protein BCR43DRAFT_433043 [Syncephalastrum racemosum]|uniref:Uncharacterized protein n=1 Tax=Syncephalastrum racemosum TaxID=13706 RepID=A0A1X2HQ72_SYNRA|nr:hypothetical protein BCR43DRAFT_433043 [Syncephalastrum racemosum]
MLSWATIFIISILSIITYACEPECRHAITQTLADRYVPALESTIQRLHDALGSNLYYVSIPEQLVAVVPETELRDTIVSIVDNSITNVTEENSGANLEAALYVTLFAGDQPFKGDCNSPPRLTRKKPPPGESWTREECQKMDYICGNPPSICHFLDDIKQRIVESLKVRLKEQARYGSGILFKNLAPKMKESVRSKITVYGAGSLLKDPGVAAYINTLATNTLRTVDTWANTEVAELCSDGTCDGWDEEVIPEILKWP